MVTVAHLQHHHPTWNLHTTGASPQHHHRVVTLPPSVILASPLRHGEPCPHHCCVSATVENHAFAIEPHYVQDTIKPRRLSNTIESPPLALVVGNYGRPPRVASCRLFTNPLYPNYAYKWPKKTCSVWNWDWPNMRQHWNKKEKSHW